MGCQQKAENCFHFDHEEYVLCFRHYSCTPLQLVGRVTGCCPQTITNFAQGSVVFCVRLKHISLPNSLLPKHYSLHCNYDEHCYTICGIFRVNDASAVGCTVLSDLLP